MRHSVRQGPQQLEAGARDCSHPRIPSQIPLKPQTIPDSSNPKSGQLSPRLGPETETQTRPAKCCCMMPRSSPQSSARQLRASADAQEALESPGRMSVNRKLYCLITSKMQPHNLTCSCFLVELSHLKVAYDVRQRGHRQDLNIFD